MSATEKLSVCYCSVTSDMKCYVHDVLEAKHPSNNYAYLAMYCKPLNATLFPQCTVSKRNLLNTQAKHTIMVTW